MKVISLMMKLIYVILCVSYAIKHPRVTQVAQNQKVTPFSASTLNFLSNDTYVVDSRAIDLELRGPKNGEKFEEKFVFAIRSSFSLLTIYQTYSWLDVRQKGIMIAQIDRKFNEDAKNGSTFSFWATQMEVIGQKRRNGRNP